MKNNIEQLLKEITDITYKWYEKHDDLPDDKQLSQACHDFGQVTGLVWRIEEELKK